MSTKPEKCSRYPQSHGPVEKSDWFYYESIGGIDVYVDAQVIRTALNEGHGYSFKIPRKMLERSLRRMLASKKAHS